MKIIKYLFFFKDFWSFKILQSGKCRFSQYWSERYPCLNDKTDDTYFDKHYIYHPAWASRKLAEIKPDHHVDISSSLSFSTIVSAFVAVKYFDCRPAHIPLSNFESGYADLMALPFAASSITSISCMHVIEHVGLGRYGGRLDPDGDLKAIAELKRVLATNGNLLIVVPIGGTPKIQFNAHRIYNYAQIAEYFSDLELIEFALITDDPVTGTLINNASKELADAQKYGCGCFWFRKVTE